MISLRNYQNSIVTAASAVLAEKKIVYLAMEPRTGKTITALSIAKKNGYSSILFITKKKAIPSIDHDFKFFEFTKKVVVNYESAHKVDGTFDLIILDESHSLGGYPRMSERAKIIKKLVEGGPVIFLSGTPTPESYSQIYHQFAVTANSPFAEKNFYQWFKKYGVERKIFVGGVPRNCYKLVDYVLMQKVIGGFMFTATQRDALFTSTAVDVLTPVEVPTRLQNMIGDMNAHSVVTIGSDQIIADSAVSKMMKLHQLAGGTIIGNDGTPLVVDTFKVDFIEKSYSNLRIAIFYKFAAEGELLRSRFGKEVAGTPESFQQGEGRVYVSQIQSVREGVKLDKADVIIIYSLDYSYLSYAQGRERHVSHERDAPAKVVILTELGGGITEQIYRVVSAKKNYTRKYYA